MPRVNRCIELLEQGQPIYYTGVEDLSYESGQALAGTWADFLSIDFEHRPFDMIGLTAFMDGLHAAGPTRSGHPTPTVIATTAISTAVPGLAFSEWGPGDMGMSFGYPSRHDPPYPPEMDAARETVKKACDDAGISFLCGWNDEAMTSAERVNHALNVIGAKVIPCGPPGEEVAEAGRALTGRTMPV